MGLTLSILLGFIPSLLFAAFIYWLDRYEKEPFLLILGAFLWGAVVAAGAAFLINTTFGIGIFLFTGSETLTDFGTSTLIAPFVEEILKGLAVLMVFLFIRREFDSVLDGIIYAAIAALGFSASENAFYIYDKGFLENGFSGIAALTFIRVGLVGWQHPFYTSFVGIGLATSRLSQKAAVKILAPLVGLSIAIFTHSFHNTLASILSGLEGMVTGLLFDWSGWLAMLVFILWSIGRERNLLVKYLADEILQGSLTQGQFQTACSAGRQEWIKFKSLFAGNFPKTREFYQLCGELAHRKFIHAKMGQEFDNAEQIQALRDKLHVLSPETAF
jgi:RsiW-degrading membrane proteinase PrsW (M82 family)